MVDLRQLFTSLPLPPPSTSGWPTVAAVQVPDRNGLRIGRDRDGRALLLIDAEGETEQPRPPYVLENLRIEHARPCQVLLPDGSTHRGVFTIVLCTATDVVLREHFLLVLGTLVETIPSPATPPRITSAINWIVELFRALQAPPRKSLQGLWAEVYLIAASDRPDVLTQSWHVAQNDRYDFSLGAARVEVKSAAGTVRQHYFSLAQLSPSHGTTPIVASLFVERAGGGTSLADLLVELRTRLAMHADLVLRLETVVVTTLGAALPTSLRERFDRERARSSLAYYHAADIPSVIQPIAVAVTDVRFRADLSAVASTSPHDVHVASGRELFAALPRPLGEEI